MIRDQTALKQRLEIKQLLDIALFTSDTWLCISGHAFSGPAFSVLPTKQRSNSGQTSNNEIKQHLRADCTNHTYLVSRD